MLISIGGLIGVGKSTVLDILKETLESDNFNTFESTATVNNTSWSI